MFVLSKLLGFFALPSNLLFALGLFGVLLMATRFAPAGQAAGGGRRDRACDLRPLAARQRVILPLEERFPPGTHGGRARRHHRARRRDRHGVSPMRAASRAQRGGRAHDRGRRACAALSRRRASCSPAAVGSLLADAARGGLCAAACSRASASPRAHRRSRTSRATPPRTPLHQGDWSSPSPASAGCWSPRRITCRARSAPSAGGFPVEAFPVD